MGTSRHIGRPIKQPSSALGSAIVSRMDAAGISNQELASRLGVSRITVWRVLQGRCRFSNRIRPDELCRALNLAGEDCIAYLSAYTSHRWPAESGIHTASDAAQNPRASEDNTPKTSNSTTAQRLAIFILDRARAVGLSRVEFARLVGISPSTLSRLANGKIARTHALKEKAIVDVLNLNASDRRTFLRLAVEAGALSLVTRVAPAQLRFAAAERALGVPLDEIEQAVIQMRARRNCGEATAVYEQSSLLFAQLFDASVSVTAMLKSPELARAKLRVGFEYCEAQASVLPWYERAPQMVRTLDRMQHEVIQHFPPGEFSSEYGHLINLRAPLYRDAYPPSRMYDAFERTIFEFTWAMERVVRTRDEPSLTVEILRNRAHVALLSGNTGRWRADLTAAGHIAGTVHPDERQMFEALVTYSWGEGFKRLADSPPLSAQQRSHYLREAQDALVEGERVFAQHARWEGYALLAMIAQAQCMVWVDPEEAVRRAGHLRAEACIIYPSLVQKVDRMAARAHEQLRAAR